MKYALVYPNWDRLENDSERSKVIRGGFLGDRPEVYEVIAEGEVEGGLYYISAELKMKQAEALFHEFNVGERRGLRCRSMSVGDLVVFSDGSFALCEMAGFSISRLPRTFEWHSKVPGTSTEEFEVQGLDDWKLIVVTNHYSYVSSLPDLVRDEIKDRVWATQDGYGTPGFVPAQGWDWSGIRDSSEAAQKEMAALVRALFHRLGIFKFKAVRSL